MLTRRRIKTHQKYCNAGCILGDHVSMEELSNHELKCRQDERDLAGMLFEQKAQRELLQVDTSAQILRIQRVCESIGPLNGELSKMHETEVHVLSDSVLCMGRGAMSRTSCQVHQKTRAIQGNSKPNCCRANSCSTYFLAKGRTRWCAKSMSAFNRVVEQMDQIFTPKHISIELFSWI